MILHTYYNSDCNEETNFWEIIQDHYHDIFELQSNVRTQIRCSLKDCDIRRVSKEELIAEDGYSVYFEAFKRYHKLVVMLLLVRNRSTTP